MVNNQDLKAYLEWEKSRDSWFANFIKKATPMHVVLLVAMILLGIYLLTTEKVNSTVVYAVMAGVVLIFIFGRKKAEEKQPIPEAVIKQINLMNLRRKIGTELPWGTIIHPTLFCKLRFEGEWGSPYRPFRWDAGYKIIKPSGLRIYANNISHPYDGYTTGIVKAPAGYDGTDAHDLKVVFPRITVQENAPKETS